ncbi:MAG: amidohydrolase family protein [Candidatus Scalindua sp.]|jgi:predicted TIM-barrel fold metal-dependent hydrolase|nr:amidohydrolase family protein [Candidatus Scalindua sp.]MDV5166192.1 amidohydrolase family protein [Candidatus Scalindua sp.]
MKKKLTKYINQLSIILKPARSYKPVWKKYTNRTLRHYACIIAIAVSLMLGCTKQVSISQALYIKGDLVLGYQPKSNLVLKQSTPGKPKYPVIDVHTHFSSDLSPIFLLEKMDELGIRAIINLSGGYGAKLDRMLEKFSGYYPDRLIIFCNLDFSKIDDSDFSEQMVTFLSAAHAKGAKGLKIFKNLGLTLKDKTGQIVAIDDARLDPVWARAGKLGMPVLIHTADPVAFFKPTDRSNERLMQLKRHPDWSFYGAEFPKRETIIAQRNRVIARHPDTIFIGAHVGNSAEDLMAIGKLLDSYPNFYVDVAARVAELGRQPYTAREFLVKYQDRILFGTDRYPGKTIQPRYKIYYRFLQTQDEYFDYYDHPFPPTGEWKIYGVFLPDEVLEKIYFKNAERLLGLR